MGETELKSRKKASRS